MVAIIHRNMDMEEQNDDSFATNHSEGYIKHIHGEGEKGLTLTVI